MHADTQQRAYTPSHHPSPKRDLMGPCAVSSIGRGGGNACLGHQRPPPQKRQAMGHGGLLLSCPWVRTPPPRLMTGVGVWAVNGTRLIMGVSPTRWPTTAQAPMLADSSRVARKLPLAGSSKLAKEAGRRIPPGLAEGFGLASCPGLATGPSQTDGQSLPKHRCLRMAQDWPKGRR
jgi:hypothetical protein